MSNLASAPSIFGVGLAYPMRLDTTASRPLVLTEQDLVKASMQRILKTDINELPFLTKNGIPFGTRIRRALFEAAVFAIDIVTYETKRALDVWEPRIIVDNVSASEVPQAQGGSLIMAVTSFRYRSTNRADNFVTPYRLVSASDPETT